MKEATTHNKMLRRSFDMQYSGASGHPLRITISDRATATVAIHVIEDAIDDVSDCFKTTMRVPWRSFWFTGCVLHFTHLIEMNKGIKFSKIYSGKGATNWKTFTLKTLRRRCYLFNGARTAPFGGRIGIHPRQDGDIGNGYCWHR